MTIKEQIQFIDTLIKQYFYTPSEWCIGLIKIQDGLKKRLNVGRKRKFANDKERWAYHNARRREQRNAEKTL